MRPCLSLPTSIFSCQTKIVTWHDICPLWIDKTFAALLRLLLLLRAQIVAPVIIVFVLGGGGGGTPLFGLNRYVLLNRVWFSGSWILNRVNNIILLFIFLNRMLFGLAAFKRVWRLAMSDLHLWDQQFCPEKIYFRDVRMKNYLILSGGKTEQIRIINIK